MGKKLLFIILLLIPFLSYAQYNVKTIDLSKKAGLEYNAAGPMLVTVDSIRNRIITANTLSSSVSIIDCKSNIVTNIPVEGRCLEHLKSEAMTLDKKTGAVYIIGTQCFFIVYPEKKASKTIKTDKQYESIAVDDNTGNVFIAGRESAALGFYNPTKDKFKLLDWVETEEKLVNMNQTPPPPIRKVISANELKKIIAVDGYTSTIYLFDSENGKQLDSRKVELTPSGRWHLPGYDEKTHFLYLVTEKADRHILEAGKIDIQGKNDVIVKLPDFTEPVGMILNTKLDQVYVPYDNHPAVHCVDFKNGGKIDEIKIPTFGNDAAAIDIKNDYLYIGSWAQGEMEVIDLKTKLLIKKIPNMGIIPHMFTMTFNKNNGMVYFPIGASAVNGNFGAALTMLDPWKEKTEKIYIGWAPIDLIEIKNKGSFLVFNNEDQFAEVKSDGSAKFYNLPYNFPIKTCYGPEGYIYLSYGPHQSYWPVVYIWGSKDGLLRINPSNFEFYDRRIPRQAMEMALDKKGILYMTQNCWGREPQFVSVIKDEVRNPDIGERIKIDQDTVQREVTERLLKYDEHRNRLYLCRVAEADTLPGIFQVIDPDSQKVIKRIEVGLNPTSMEIGDDFIFISNADSKTVTSFDLVNYSKSEFKTGEYPLKLCIARKEVFVINHLDNTLQEIGGEGKIFSLPKPGTPDNIINWNEKVVITSHLPNELNIFLFDPTTEKFETIHTETYPYGDTKFNTINSSFYISGQFGDAIYSITPAKVAKDGKLWMADFLSGKVYIISK